jgi:hypothetical protein
MNSYESQFRAIVGHDYDPSEDLDAAQARALSALIFGMPMTQVLRDGARVEYAGWSVEQDTYLSVIVTDDHKAGMEAVCETYSQIASGSVAGI